MDYQAKQKARASAVNALHATHPHLVPVDKNSLTAAAKNIRTELRTAFPGVKFSVRSSRFSGGDSITVSWTDGPNGDQVDAIVHRYKAGSFDGMQDLYEYDDRAWTDAFGDAKYISTSRDASEKAVASAIRTVANVYAANFKSHSIPVPSVQQYRSGDLRNVRVIDGATMHDDLHSLIQREICRRTWSLTQPPRKPAIEADLVQP